jgi:hypothetical protein
VITDSGIWQWRRHHTATLVGHPGLLQERHDIAALLSQRACDGEQAAAADRTLAGTDAMDDLALSHRLAQGTLSSVVCAPASASMAAMPFVPQSPALDRSPSNNPRQKPSASSTASCQLSASRRPEARVGLKLWSPLGSHRTRTRGESG